MVDLDTLRHVCGKYQCQVELETTGADDELRYVAVLRCPQPDNGKLVELQKQIRVTWPEIDRVVLDITPSSS